MKSLIILLVFYTVSVSSSIPESDDQLIKGQDFVAQEIVPFTFDVTKGNDLKKYIKSLLEHVMQTEKLKKPFEDQILSLIKNLNHIRKEFETNVDGKIGFNFLIKFNNLILISNYYVEKVRQTLIDLFHSNRYAIKWIEKRQMFLKNEEENETLEPYEALNNRLFVIKTYLTDSVNSIEAYEQNLVRKIDSIKLSIKEVVQKDNNKQDVDHSTHSINTIDKKDTIMLIEELVQYLKKYEFFKHTKDGLVRIIDIFNEEPTTILSTIMDLFYD